MRRILLSSTVHRRVGWLMVSAVIVLSLVPTAPLLQIAGGYDDKLAHGLIYGGLTAWFAVAMARSTWVGEH